MSDTFEIVSECLGGAMMDRCCNRLHLLVLRAVVGACKVRCMSMVRDDAAIAAAMRCDVASTTRAINHLIARGHLISNGDTLMMGVRHD